jgi:hypothetical protein
MQNRIYAIVYPPIATPPSDSFVICCVPCITLFHKARYEQILGYSLGHKPKFFTTLEAAQAEYLKPVMPRYDSAILEMDFDQDKGMVTKFNKIFKYYEKPQAETYTVPDYDKKFTRTVNKPAWEELPLTDYARTNTVTPGALQAINKQYREEMKLPPIRENTRLMNKEF